MGPPRRDLVPRCRVFSGRLLRYCDRVACSGSVPGHVVDQLTRAGTSIGGHNAEAESALTRRHLTALRGGALREAREAQYWLHIVADYSQATDPDTRWLQQEVSELIAILTTIVAKLRGDP